MDGVLGPPLEHAKLGHVAVGHGELTSGGQRLEHFERLVRFALRGLFVTEKPLEPRQPAVCIALPKSIAAQPVFLERLTPRLDRFADLVGQVALVRAPLEQRGATFRWKRLGFAKRPGELLRSLAMSA